VTALTNLKRCIYCIEEKPQEDFSLEHLWPRRLGGVFCSDFFKTRDVCTRCNSIAGLYIDGPFSKSAFVANDAASSEALRAFIDPRVSTSTQPLAYMGVAEGIVTSPQETCELWIGACGTQYYHIHDAEEDLHWQAFTGGNPRTRRSDPGRVYIAFTTMEEDWVSLALRSGFRYFEDAKRYGAGVILGESGGEPYLHRMDAAAEAEAERILAMPNKKQTQVAINVAFDHRFMAKLALGLGCNLFGTAFAISEYGNSLRGLMRGKTHEERAAFDIRGLNFLDGAKDSTSEYVAFKGGYTLLILAPRDEMILSVNFPSGRPIHIVMANDPALWSDARFNLYREGAVFVIVPQVERFAGPLRLAPYVSHLHGGPALPELQAIEAMRVASTTLPPCR
jgi:hypothetical protein